MLYPSRHHPMLQSRRSTLPRLLVLALSLALGACDDANDPLAPAEDPPVPATEAAPNEAVASGDALALTTGQRILFLSYKYGAPEIYKMDPQGNSRVHLTSADYETTAAWSWDNKRVALVRQRPYGNSTQTDIYLINADGSNGHWAAATPSPWPVTDPSWSPDGSRLVVRLFSQNASYLGRMDVATGKLTPFNVLQGGIKGARPSYYPTGQRIVYIGVDYKTIEQINADGSGHKTRFSSATWVWDPTFSPDGKKIAFARAVGTTGNNSEIFVKNLVDGTVKRLTTSAGTDNHPSWSPDGSRIAFSSQRSGVPQIWTMNAATGGSLVRITHTANWEEEPAWTH